MKILVGVCGGIAAYKSAELVRLYSKAGHEVRVVQTKAATEFVGPLTFQALSGNEVRIELFDESHEAAMGHIELARWADTIVVAPATANIIAKLANGIADDLLTTVVQASECPLAIAPAMNRAMWLSEATQRNISLLSQRGVQIIGPGDGEQACGDVGEGRMSEAQEIFDQLSGALGDTDKLNIVITAGPTVEAIDPVRFISNRSSGKMGFALASVFQRSGHHVTLIAGPVSVETPRNVNRIDVESTFDMRAAISSVVDKSDIFISAAAVSDYRVASVASEKIKKDTTDDITLTLLKNPDLLSEVAALPDGPFCVGFAAETSNVASYAKAKLAKKQINMIAANDVSRADIGFNAEENEMTVFWRGGQRSIPKSSKFVVAVELKKIILEQYNEKKHPTQNT